MVDSKENDKFDLQVKELSAHPLFLQIFTYSKSSVSKFQFKNFIVRVFYLLDILDSNHQRKAVSEKQYNMNKND